MTITQARPRCPLCGGPMRLSGTQAAAGHVVEWRCVASACTGLVAAGDQGTHDDPRSAGEDYLGAPVEDLMRAPVTPQGSGSGGGRQRRQPKAGEVQAQRERRQERRSYDQAPLLGGRDREVHVERLEGHLQARTSTEEEQLIKVLLERHPGLKRSDLVRLGLAALRDRVARGGVPCQDCGMPILNVEKRCPACGA